MTKQALVSLPVLAAVVLFLTGCPKSSNPPTNPTKGAGQRNAAAAVVGEGNPAAQQASTKSAKVDPIQANGPIFVDWPKPKVAIVITGEQRGYIEPCGCAGLENQKGGLSRRHSLLKKLEADGWPVVAVDLGGNARRFGRQAEIKYQTTVEALKMMKYSALAFGADDLRLPAIAAMAIESRPGPFVAANVAPFGFDEKALEQSRVVEAGGVKVGITTILGDSFQKELHNDEIALAPAEASLAELAPLLKTASDFRLLLSHASIEESRALAKRFPEFQAVVTAGGADEPPREARRVEGSQSLLIEVGHKGMFAIVLGIYDDPAQPIRYQRVPLDSRFEDSPEMKQLMTAYQDQLRDLGFEGLELRATAHPRSTAPGDTTGLFVGSKKCGECHTHAWGIWSKSHHAQATETLVKLSPSRQYDPECLSCHTTGWNPQEFFPYESGFAGLEKTPLLAGNGCENCHGPGGAHVAAEAGKNLTLRNQQRALMRLTKATAELQSCVKCHDGDNSPHFDYSTYWPKIDHSGNKK